MSIGEVLDALGSGAINAILVSASLICAGIIMCAVLAVPALKTLGIPLLTAQMIVFWFSMDSTITPPVCISAYAAAGISGGHPMKTGLAAWKMAKGLYIIPVLMAYTKLLTGSITEVLIVAVPALLGILSFNIVWEGFLIRRTYVLERLVLVFAIAFLFYARIYSYIIGTVILAAVTLTQKFIAREKALEGVSIPTA